MMDKKLTGAGMPTANHSSAHNGDYTTIPTDTFEDDAAYEMVVDDDEPIIEILGAEYSDQDLVDVFCSNEESYVLVDVMPEDDIAEDDIVVEDDFITVDDIDMDVEVDDNLQTDDTMDIDDDIQIEDDFM